MQGPEALVQLVGPSQVLLPLLLCLPGCQQTLTPQVQEIWAYCQADPAAMPLLHWRPCWQAVQGPLGWEDHPWLLMPARTSGPLQGT